MSVRRVKFRQFSPLAIRMVMKGCCNRPFFHIVVVKFGEPTASPGFEQLGVYDPMPNERNEELLSLNIERFQYWVAQGAAVRTTAGMLLGLAGVLPHHPHTFRLAYKRRQRKLREEKEQAAAENSNE